MTANRKPKLERALTSQVIGELVTNISPANAVMSGGGGDQYSSSYGWDLRAKTARRLLFLRSVNSIFPFVFAFVSCLETSCFSLPLLEAVSHDELSKIKFPLARAFLCLNGVPLWARALLGM